MPEANSPLNDTTRGDTTRGDTARGTRRRPPRGLASRLSALRRPAPAERPSPLAPDPELSPGDERYLQRVHDFLHLLNGEWDWDVLVALSAGPLQYTELLDTVRERTPASKWAAGPRRYLQERALSRTLQRLTGTELVHREREVDFPYAAAYRLAPPAAALLDVMTPAAEWAEAHSGLLGRAQERRRRAPDA
ncbi:winged helix-turn-helix transcriptional regulator [Streptomyces sp. NPDC059009]|uniref:winged helix-turn-helix transcriptional regulator n=1 Tax=Streptomyces sp. NPDC059009 TaxID=3346694 RepID=UPI003680DAD2